MSRSSFIVAVLVSLMCVRHTSAIVIGQIDDFQDGTTANWTNGGIIGVTPVTNIPNGGPGGVGDHYIQVTSDGSGSGGKLTVFNRDQWLGDYPGIGITSIDVDLLNQSTVQLSIRMAFKNGPGNSASGYLTQAMILPVGSGWQHFTISLNPADLIPVGTPDPWQSFFIGEVRFIHAPGTNSLSGVPVVGQLGIDNIRAVPEPATTALIAAGLLLVLGSSRKRNRVHDAAAD